MAEVTPTLNYQSSITPPEVADLASVSRRFVAGVVEVFVEFSAWYLVGAAVSVFTLSEGVLSVWVGVVFAAVIGTEMLDRNVGRIFLDLRLHFETRPTAWHRFGRALLVRPLTVCWTLGITVVLNLRIQFVFPVALSIAGLFSVVDLIVLLATRRRIGDHAGNTWVVRTHISA